jgi:hypothetical protein
MISGFATLFRLAQEHSSIEKPANAAFYDLRSPEFALPYY